MVATYLSLMLMFAVGALVAGGMFAATSLLGPKKPSAEKGIPYESGSETEGGRHVKLSVKFYVTAILFVVFDVEAVFLYPWAIQFRSLGWAAAIAMLAFLVTLALALVYVWRKGALEWER